MIKLQRMKNKTRNKLFTILIIIINVVFVFALFLVEYQYISSSREQTVKRNEGSFLNTNASLVSMTNNYLIGERNLCRSWSKYLNSDVKSMDEAIEYVKESIIDNNVMCHIVYKTKTNLTGYSTTAKASDPTNYTVDYSSLKNSVFNSDAEGVKISSSYINPINGAPSIAFYNDIKLKDPDNPAEQVDAYLLRVVLRDNLKKRWTFPRGSFENMEVAICDKDGNYIIKGTAFKNSNFFEFYKSYNKSSGETINNLITEVDTHVGLMKMKYNEKGEECYIAYSQLETPEERTSNNNALNVDWIILTYTPVGDITTVSIDWSLIAILGIGLVALFGIDLAFLLTLNKNLSDTAKVADSANKAKTDFLSAMSHDIRTPMNAIVGLTNIAKRQIDHQDVVADCLRKIELSSNHLLTLINDILDISKVESGRLSINPITFSISEIMENLVNISNPMVKAKNLEFNFRVHDFEHEYLYSDKLRLNQIFINILSNAIKYTPEKGRIDADIFEKDCDKEGYLKLICRIADNGIGMSEEFMKKMYEPFSRATDSRVNTIQGTGLGLAITKRMVEMLGGTIECQSKLGEGTTFTISIDVQIADRPEEEMVLPPLNILLADDDEILLTTAKSTLEGLGAKVDTVNTGQGALDMVVENHKHKDNRYKVVILDWKMPDIDGLEVARLIKEKIDHDMPIIMVSSYDWSEMEETAREIGIDGFIYKPLFKSKVYEQIVEALGLEAEQHETVEEATDLVGLHVLVTEDNEINWEIISTLLKMNGVTSVHAENGKVAVEMIENHEEDFDLVFMDIQMPVLNGLDATRQIRNLDSDYAKNIPIVAMTADAFSENIAECLAAGMNGHIAKPIDMNLVIKELHKVKEKKK